MRASPVVDRLMDKVSPEPNTGCWLWVGATSRDGYGLIGVGGKTKRAHIVSYEIHVGPIPDDRPQLDHLCRTRCCINPQHLEPVTPKENTRRGHPYDVGGPNRGKIVCKNGHSYSEENTYISAKGWRYCHVCDKNRKAVRAAGSKARPWEALCHDYL